MALGIPMAMLIAGGIGAAGGVAGGLLGKGKSMSQGYDIVKAPTYDWGESNQKYLSDYYGANLENYKKGKLNPGMQAFYDQMREGMGRSNYQTTYGRPGERTGTMGTAMEAGALTGLGARSTMAQTGKASKDYADREKAIDEYLAGLKSSSFQQGEQFSLQGLQALPRGPEYQIVNQMGGVSGGNVGGQMGDIAGQALGSIPWEQMWNAPQQYGSQGYGSTFTYGSMPWQTYTPSTPPAGSSYGPGFTTGSARQYGNMGNY